MNRSQRLIESLSEAKSGVKLSADDYLNILMGRTKNTYSIKDLKSVDMEEILDELVIPERAERDGWERVLINVKKFDRLWKETDPEMYLGKGGVGGIKNRYSNFIAFLITDPVERKRIYGNIETPEVEITEGGEIRFVNGRHRYSVFRDMRVKYLPVAMPLPERAEQLGLLK